MCRGVLCFIRDLYFRSLSNSPSFSMKMRNHWGLSLNQTPNQSFRSVHSLCSNSVKIPSHTSKSDSNAEKKGVSIEQLIKRGNSWESSDSLLMSYLVFFLTSLFLLTSFSLRPLFLGRSSSLITLISFALFLLFVCTCVCFLVVLSH